MKLSVVTLPNEIQASAIAQARLLLSGIESGEVVGFSVIKFSPSGTYSIGGSASLSRHQAAGMLLEAAMERINS